MRDLWQPVLVCYDVASNRKRTKLRRLLLEHGMTDLQKSVFWGRLRAADLRAIQREFGKLLDKGTDRAFWVRLPLDEQTLQKQGFGYRSVKLPDPDGYAVF